MMQHLLLHAENILRSENEFLVTELCVCALVNPHPVLLYYVILKYMDPHSIYLNHA